MKKSNFIFTLIIIQVIGLTQIWPSQNKARNDNKIISGLSNHSILRDYLHVSNQKKEQNDHLLKVVSCNPPPTVLATCIRTIICKGETTTLTASGANTYTWNPGGPGASIAVSPSVVTTYTVIGTDINTCTNSAVIQIKVASLPNLFITTTNSLTCAGESVTLTAGGPYTFTWSTAQTGSVIIINPTSTTNYSLTASNGCLNTFFYTQNVDACTFIESNSAFYHSTIIYPNPNNGIFKINVFDFDGSKVVMYNIDGQEIISKTLSSTISDFNINTNAKGIYFLQITDKNNNLVIKKIIIQ